MTDRLHYLSILLGLQKDDKLSCGSYDCRACIFNVLHRPIIDRLTHAAQLSYRYAYSLETGSVESLEVDL